MIYEDINNFVNYNSSNGGLIHPAYQQYLNDYNTFSPGVVATYSQSPKNENNNFLSSLGNIELPFTKQNFKTPDKKETIKGMPELHLPVYEVPNTQSESTNTSFSGTHSTDINKNIKSAANFFNTQGLSKVAIAGIIGNLKAESQLIPTSIGDKNLKTASEGIAQWRESRLDNLKNYAKSKNKAYTDFGTQLEFLNFELKSNPKLIKDLNSANTPEEAARIFSDRFEKPKYFDTKRANFAKIIYGNI